MSIKRLFSSFLRIPKTVSKPSLSLNHEELLEMEFWNQHRPITPLPDAGTEGLPNFQKALNLQTKCNFETSNELPRLVTENQKLVKNSLPLDSIMKSLLPKINSDRLLAISIKVIRRKKMNKHKWKKRRRAARHSSKKN